MVMKNASDLIWRKTAVSSDDTGLEEGAVRNGKKLA
jgi:hypothetical protein